MIGDSGVPFMQGLSSLSAAQLIGGVPNQSGSLNSIQLGHHFQANNIPVGELDVDEMFELD